LVGDDSAALILRLKITGFVTAGLVAVLAGALFDLQVIKHGEYREISENYYIIPAEIKAPRGDIVDRNGDLVAGSRQAFSICGIPRRLLRNSKEIEILSNILGMSADEIKERLKRTSQSYRPTVIARDVDFRTISMVEEMFSVLTDVIVISEPVRRYPLAEVLSHVVGYVGEVTEADIEKHDGYGVGDLIGKVGIERDCETDLRGSDGLRYLKFTPGGSSPVDFKGKDSKAPRKGKTVHLTIDNRLQRFAAELLAGRRGAITALDPSTGEVLALVSTPGFDPNLFATGISGKDWQRILEADGNPLLNRAIQSKYPPGSVFKIVTAAIGLEEGKLSAKTRFQPCYGGYRFGNRLFACWKPQGHGSVDLVGAIAVSCDVYFYQLAERLDLETFNRYATIWHLNDLAGIDLPGEVKGFVPRPSDYDSLYGQGGWTKGVQLNLGIGQGELLLTPIEIATFVCAIANGGYYYTPHCVRQIGDGSRSRMKTGKRVDLPISQSTVDVVREGMLEVVESERGTGRSARIEGVKVAGKTGTAENPHGKDHASFVCFASDGDRRLVLYIIVENAGHGGEIAAPIAGKLLARYFRDEKAAEVAIR